MIPFAMFAPDRSAFDPKASDRIVNVIPKASSYGPFPSFQPITTSLPGAIYGAFLAKDSTGAFHTFAGTTAKLLKLNPLNQTWTDVSKTAFTYSTPTTEAWEFQQYGDRVIATNFVDPIQAFNLLGGTKFTDLAATAPRALHLGVIGDFLFTGQTDANVREVRWSGLNDETWWTVRQRSADVQPFPDGGRVQAIAGFEKGGLIFQENCIREMGLALDTPLIFTVRKAVQDHGAIAPKSVVNAGSGGVFYLSQDGFYRYGEPPTPIGNEQVDQFFYDNADATTLYEVQGAVDPARKVVYWRWKSTAHSNPETTDRVLAYHYALNRWSLIEVELSWLLTAVSPGYTLEGLDGLGYTLETLPFSLDSRAWAGGAPVVGAFDSLYRLGLFGGAAMQPTLQTSDVGLANGQRAIVSGFRLIGDAPVAQGRVAGRDTHSSDRSWDPLQDINKVGVIPARRSSRLHRFEVTIPAGTAWSHVHGIDPMVRPEGQR